MINSMPSYRHAQVNRLFSKLSIDAFIVLQATHRYYKSVSFLFLSSFSSAAMMTAITLIHLYYIPLYTFIYLIILLYSLLTLPPEYPLKIDQDIIGRIGGANVAVILI